MGSPEIYTVEEIRPSDRPSDKAIYWVQLGLDFATRQYFKEDELESFQLKPGNLLGSRALVKIRNGSEDAGRIIGVKKEHYAADIESAVNFTTFSVAFDDGSTADVLGDYLSKIENDNYIKATRPI
jgi:hypothetical protein